MEFKAVYISEIGNNEQPFAYAGTNDSGQLVEEEWDHGLQQVTATSVKLEHQQAGQGFYKRSLEVDNIKISLYVTDSRIALHCPKYDKGGGWGGGSLAAPVLNVASKLRAHARSKGKILLGQIRYEWLRAVGYYRRTGFLGIDQLLFGYYDSDKTAWKLTLTLKKDTDSEFLAHDILNRAAKYRLAMTDENDKDELEFFKDCSSGRRIEPAEDKKKFSVINFPSSYEAPTGEGKRPTK